MGVHNVSTIPLGIDTEMFNPRRRDPGWKVEVGAHGPGLVALYVGRFAGEKGLDVLIEALPHLEKSAMMKLVVIGEGHMREQLGQISREWPGRLTLLPFERDPNRLARAYASADLYIAPFPYETFGLAAVEAMASGTPVLGADSGGLRDLLLDAECGRLFKPGDADDLAQKATEISGEDLQTMGAEARALVEQRYSWDQTFGEMVSLYRSLLGRRENP